MNAPQNDVNAITDLQKRWSEAELQGDSAALESLLDDGFHGVGPAGFVLDKNGWIERYRSGDLKNNEFGWENTTEVRFYGDTAVVIGIQSQKTVYQGHEVPGGPFRFTQIAVRRGDQWVGAGLHLSNIVQRPG